MTDRCADLCIPLPPGDEFSVWNLLWISQPDVAGQMLYFCFGDPNYTVNCGRPVFQGRNHSRRCFHSFE